MKLYSIMSNEAIKASGGNRGKMVAQGGHAFTEAVFDAQARFPWTVRDYRATGVVAKICLQADEEQLLEMFDYYKTRCGCFLVRDAGLTVFAGPMITALGVGPINPDDREDILKAARPWK